MRVVWCSLVLAGAVTLAGAQSLAGSDYLAGALAPALAQRWPALSLVWPGSLPALEAVRAGRVDLALVAAPPGEPPPAGLRSAAFAHWAAVVVLPRSNPRERFSLAELGGVFRAGPTGNPTWGALGLGSSWRTRDVALTLWRPPEDLSLALFEALALDGAPWRATVNRVQSAAEFRQRLEREEGFLGLAPFALREGGRAVPLARDEGGEAFAPTVENIVFGDYPLAVPCRVVLRSPASPAALEVARWLLSDEGAELLAAAGWVVPGAADRRRLETELRAP